MLAAIASAIAPCGGTRLCGDGERSDQSRSGIADAILDGDGDGYVLGETAFSKESCCDIACVFRCSWLAGLPRIEEDAALTAADAGVTVIATEVLTTGDGWSVDVVVLSVDMLLGALGAPF